MSEYEEPFNHERMMKIVIYVRLQTGAVAFVDDGPYHKVSPALQRMFWSDFLEWAHKKVGAIP